MSYPDKAVKILFMHFLFAFLPAAALAGDMNMKQGAGGLVLQQRENIAVISQEVYVSADLVEVNYIFLNRSKRDITATVMFPLPLQPVMPASGGMTPAVRLNTAAGGNSIGFETWVGNEKIDPAFQTKRMSGFAYGYDNDVVRTTCYWEQTFPADEPVYIRHRYRPVIGRGISLPAVELLKMAQAGDYCSDGAFRASVYYKATYEKYDYASYDDISYILTNGKNWAGGVVGDFRLVVDKGSPDALVAFCGSDIKKISPTKSEIRMKNFQPRRDVNVFILRDWSRETYH